MNRIRVGLILTALAGVLYAFPNLLVDGYDFIAGVTVAGAALVGLAAIEWSGR